MFELHSVTYQGRIKKRGPKGAMPRPTNSQLSGLVLLNFVHSKVYEVQRLVLGVILKEKYQ